MNIFRNWVLSSETSICRKYYYCRPNNFTGFLQYILKTQAVTNQEIKKYYYKIFNGISDDNFKNQVSGLLDFIFNASKQKERIDYKRVKQEEERKSEFLRELNVKPIEVEVKEKKEEKDGKEDNLSKKEKKKLKKDEKASKQNTPEVKRSTSF